MNKDNIIRKVCVMWAFLFITSLVCVAARKVEEPGSSPDFAFPKKVSADARKQLYKAMSDKNGAVAIQALMQVVIADNLISQENAGKGAALIDSVAERLAEPYSSLAYLLEARLYRDIYSANSYRYNSRTIPSVPVPADVSEWSRDIFSNRVCGLVDRAFESVSAAKGMSIASIQDIVTNAEDATAAGQTVYDFMTIQGVAALQPFSTDAPVTIPFYAGAGKGDRATERTASGLIKRIVTDNESWHRSIGLTRSGAMMAGYRLGLTSGSKREESLRKIIDEYKETPFCGGFIAGLGKYVAPSENKEYCDLYNLAKGYLDKYPECSDASSLEAMLKNMKAVWVSCTLPSQNLPGKEMKGSVTFRNIPDFYILAVKLGDSSLGRNVKMPEVLNGKVISSIKIVSQDIDKEPFYAVREFTFPSLESGVYAMVVSKTADKTGIIKDSYSGAGIPVMLVSRLSAIRTTDVKKKSGANQAFYVVEGSNQQPVKGAKVTFTPAWKNNKWKTVTLVTDKDGKVEVPQGSYKVSVKSDNDILLDDVYEYGTSSEPKETLRGNLFTDLSIYHPGDTVRFTGVLYKSMGSSLESAPNRNVKVILNDANYIAKDTLTLRSDRFGRLDGEFTLPSDGLLGNWSLMMNDGKNYVSQGFFEVAEYKSPTFYVTADSSEGEITLGETVKIKGEVKTYSGMPVAGAEIKYNVRYLPWRWGRISDSGNATFGGTATTLDDGSFVIELPTAGLKGTPYSIGRYQLNIAATDRAGETQEATPFMFSLGKGYRISSEIPEYIKITKGNQPKVTVAVYDMLDRPVIKRIYYRVKMDNDSVTIASGDFESGRLPLDFDALKSGRYTVDFSLDPTFEASEENSDEYSAPSQSTFVIWRENDSKPPVETPLWMPEKEIIVSSENISDGKIKVKVGSSYPDSYLLAEIADINGVSESRWIRVSDDMIEIPVKSPADTERVKVTISGMHDLDGVQSSVTLIPVIQTKGLEIKAESFRDRIVPGAREEWKFRFTFDNKDLASLPVMAVMSNKALNALAPFQWAFNPYSSIYWALPGEIIGHYRGTQSWSYRPVRQENSSIKVANWPEWNTYGYSLYGGSNLSNIRIRGTRMMKSASDGSNGVVEALAGTAPGVAFAKQETVEEMKVSYDYAAATGAMKEEAINDSDGGEIETGGSSSDVMREVECPLAFFMPRLTTDSVGVAEIDFNAPAFNGTWQLQVMGYTPDMRGAVLTRDVIASKPVMVQMNAPRFARTGDLMTLSATIFNNSADSASIGGKIVIYNPITGDAYVSEDFASEEVTAMGSRVISTGFRVPSNIELVGIRVYGSGTVSSDGEQTVIPIYPSSTPVVESSTFYLSPGDDKMSISIPADRKDGSLTLNYTDNPVWECVTALPALTNPDSGNALAQVRALYGNAMAAGLLGKYPRLMEALHLFSDPANASDSTLVSALQKNASLKIVALNNTPWVRNAQSETMRMEALSEYTDEAKSRRSIEDNIKKLGSLQNGDGGWSWCDGMESSEWITTSVLRHLAMLEKAGFLPEAAAKMSKKGLAYVDSQTVKEWKKIGAKKFSYISMLEYLYVRSFFGNVKTSSDFAGIKAKVIQEIEKTWKKMSIYDKAVSAIILKREGRDAVALAILSSLEEYSSSSKEKGVWFDNLHSGFNGKGKLLTTAQALEAWNEINPTAPVVDGLRQWLLLSKQTQDWGGGTEAADVVQAILDSGTDWTVAAASPEIFINGDKIEIGKISALTGALNLSLTGKNGELTIRRSASGPAWGGIVSQYVAPIADVKPASVAQLSIEKNLYVITDHSDGTSAKDGDLKKGDRVRVTLTIKCDRDLQYVAVTDGRSASLEPADQVSGYTSSDGVWFYREVRNSSTNLFIPFLSKGTHIISYDCYVDRSGEYSLGIAEAQSQYAPVITAHSGGEEITVNE